MATIIYRDVKKYRYLPIKEIAVLLTNNDVVRFGELRDGSRFTIEPIVTKSDGGNEFPVAYRASLEAILTQNNAEAMKQHLLNIANSTIKGVRVWFNLNYTLNSEPNGEMLLFSTFDDETTYNLEAVSKINYDYDETPVIKLMINLTLTAAQAVNRWYEYNWQNINW